MAKKASFKDFALEWLIYARETVSGKKSYAMGILLILSALGGYLTGQLDGQKAFEWASMGLSVIFLRAGISKTE